MGWIKRVTGIQAEENAIKANGDAQLAATKQAEENNNHQLASAAKAATDAQAQAAARSAAEDKASTILSTPMQTADVELTPIETQAAADERRRRAASFGQDYETGVSI